MVAPTLARAQPDSVPRVVGRWDLRVQGRDGVYPSWLEVTTSMDADAVAARIARRLEEWRRP